LTFCTCLVHAIRMTSLSDYRLWWSSACHAATSPTEQADSVAQEQYVFATQEGQSSTEFEAQSLRRVRSVEDMLLLLSGGDHSGAKKIVVFVLALLGGNLVANGQWQYLFTLAMGGVVLAIGAHQAIGKLLILLLGLSFLRSVCGVIASICSNGFVLPEHLSWCITVALIAVLAVSVMILVQHFVEEDTRHHVLLLKQETGSVTIHNDCFMDIKLLVFDGFDVVRLVPRAGLLSGSLLKRGCSHFVGNSPPYVVKIYAPMERELGAFLVQRGTYSFRATTPSLQLTSASFEAPVFKNSSGDPVCVCMCSIDCWTRSLWLPFTSLFARLIWRGVAVAPEGIVPLLGPCVLRVFLTGLKSLSQEAWCMVTAHESAEYTGRVHWSAPPKKRMPTSSSSEVLQPIH